MAGSSKHPSLTLSGNYGKVIKPRSWPVALPARGSCPRLGPQKGCPAPALLLKKKGAPRTTTTSLPANKARPVFCSAGGLLPARAAPFLFHHECSLPTPHRARPAPPQARYPARMPRVRSPRRYLGAPAHLPAVRPRGLLRRLEKQARYQAFSRYAAPRYHLRAARRALGLVLPRPIVWRVLRW